MSCKGRPPDSREVHLTLNDLRRTVGSWMALSGETLHTVGEVLRHRDRTTTARHSLVLSIETPEEKVDIWTPVAQQVGVPVAVVT